MWFGYYPEIIFLLQIKTPLVGQHAFPLIRFVCRAAHVTFGGSGGIIRTTLGLKTLHLVAAVRLEMKSPSSPNPVFSTGKRY